jgi:hypothetical protein
MTSSPEQHDVPEITAEQITNLPTKAERGGSGSFCIPLTVVDALIKAQANAYEVATYLVLARFTDKSGVYSTASLSAVNRYTGANKTKGGSVYKALERLKSIRAVRVQRMHNGRSGKSAGFIDQEVDLGPILYDRQGWIEDVGELLPDGPAERMKVLHVLPDFGENHEDRVWFGNGLVDGFGLLAKPLKTLKDAGPVASRLLLALYQANDMETWGGVRPIGNGAGPWIRYEPVGSESSWKDLALIFRAKVTGKVGHIDMFKRVWHVGEPDWWNVHDDAGGPVWRALEALVSAGLIYQVVLVLNRNPEKKKFSSGAEYGDIPQDAEPYYELDCRSLHGYKPPGESDGIGWLTARTAGELGISVALAEGKFDGTYAAIVPRGFGCMIAGIFRLRFRVSNPKNAGVSGTWAGIHTRNREALDFVNRMRKASNLKPLSQSNGKSLKNDKPEEN